MVTVTRVEGGAVVFPTNVDMETGTEEVLVLMLVDASVVVSTTVDVEMGTEEVLDLELVGTTTTVDVESGTEEVLDLELDLVGETVRVEVTKTVDVTVLFMFEELLLLDTLPG